MNAPVEQSRAQAPAGSVTMAGAGAPSQLQCGPWFGGLFVLAGGLALWGLLEMFYPVFALPAGSQGQLSEEQLAELGQAMAENACQNAIVVAAALGVILAGALAAAESMARWQWWRLVWRVLLAAVLAGAAGVAGGLLGSRVHEAVKLDDQYVPLMKTILTQATMLGFVGLGIGLGVGLPYRVRLLMNCVIGGVLACLFVAILYPVAIGYFLPLARTEHAIPDETSSRLIWVLAIALFTNVVMTGLGQQRKPASK